MKRKTYFTTAGEKVELNKSLNISWETEKETCSLWTDRLSEDTADELVKKGVLTVSYGEDKTDSSIDLMSCIMKMLERHGVNNYIGVRIFENFENTCPHMVLNLILMEIAFELDKKYPDHISNSEKIFTISMTDGLIHEVPKKMIRSWGGFPAFRTKEDAKLACNIVSSDLRLLFKPTKNEK